MQERPFQNSECFGYALTCQSLRPRPFEWWFCPHEPSYFQTCSAATDRDNISHGAYDGICPYNMSPRDMSPRFVASCVLTFNIHARQIENHARTSSSAFVVYICCVFLLRTSFLSAPRRIFQKNISQEVYLAKVRKIRFVFIFNCSTVIYQRPIASITKFLKYGISNA